jgi:hypothetical protein
MIDFRGLTCKDQGWLDGMNKLSKVDWEFVQDEEDIKNLDKGLWYVFKKEKGIFK